MGKIVGGFLVPHDPVMYVAPDAPEESKSKAVWEAYAECARRLDAMDATSVIVVGCDHYILFGTSCLPQYVIATGDLDGPVDPLPGLPRGRTPNNERLASHIAETGFDTGYDWTVARYFTIDHSVAIPDRLIIEPLREKGKQIATVPVYLACGVDPYIRLPKAAELGAHIRAAVESFPDDERVAVIGSGGISHWVGTPEMGRVNEDFDREIIDYALKRDLDGLCGLSDEYILAEGGNGGMEIRNFACAMGAVPYDSAELIEYQPVREWVTGLGFIELKVS